MSFLSQASKTALKIALIYLVVSGLWILFSDRILYFFVTNSDLLTRIQTVKGWGFVLVTAVMIFFLLQRELERLIDVRRRLRESESKYRMVVDSSPDLLYRTDMEGHIVFVSPSVKELSGYTEDEAVGMDLAKEVYLNPMDRERFLAQLNVRGHVENFEARLRKKDGTVWWASTNAHFYRDSEGNIAGIEGITRDVTLKKESEQALMESEHQLRAILEANPDPMVVYNLKGHPLYMNPAFTQVFGWAFDELKGRKIPFVPDDQVPLTQGKIKELFDSRKPFSFETRRLRKDGRELDIILSASVIQDDHDVPYGMVVNITDVSEKKRLEAQYEQAQKMESLGTLAGGIAHDFNNFLSGILGYMDLARKHTESEKATGYLSKALKATERARSLTHQLLTFSKGGEPVKEVAPIGSFIEETVRFALSGAEVSCDLVIPQGLWACEYDKNQLGQALDNIVINALHAMPDRGRIVVKAKNLQISGGGKSLAPGAYVKISVTDSGTGIAPDHMKRIFDPFFSTKPKGSGLGLSTSYSIVKRHNGTITVDSQPGHGTTFHLFLPATGEALTIQEEPPVSEYRGEGSVLIMDDEAMVRDLLGQMLESMGFTVLSARNGEQALEAFQTARAEDRPLAAVILDLTIPGGMGGKETVAQIRKLDDHIPVFVASGYSEDAAVASPAAFGFTASIEKPFLISALADLFRVHVG